MEPDEKRLGIGDFAQIDPLSRLSSIMSLEGTRMTTSSFTVVDKIRQVDSINDSDGLESLTETLDHSPSLAELESTSRPLESWREARNQFGKRAFDLSLAMLLAIPAIPLILICMILIRLTSAGPALYSQQRIGRRRREFTIYKLRSMYHDCERLTGPKWASLNDSRVTMFGHILRQTHIDELPQLWNVIRGDMSLVGPRPERPNFVTQLEKTIPRYRQRHQVRPGVTGLAQVQLPPDTNEACVRTKLAYDLHYIEHRDLWLDLRLVAATALKVFCVPCSRFCSWLRIPGNEGFSGTMESYSRSSTSSPSPMVGAPLGCEPSPSADCAPA